MAPVEWLVCYDATVLKTDCTDHGDDHFYPGPCDIAWDLAGAMIEWQLDREQSELLLRRCRHGSGDDAEPRLNAYRLAYAAFRVGWTELALASAGVSEKPGLSRLRATYRRELRRATGSIERKPAVTWSFG